MTQLSTNDIQPLRAAVGHAPVNLTGVCALILNDSGEVLLQSRETGGWGTPSGICELGEALEDTLRRELQEVAGITPLGSQLLTIISGPETYQKLPNGDEFYQITAVYVVQDWQGTPRPHDQAGAALRFFALDALPSALSTIDQKALQLLRVCWSVW